MELDGGSQAVSTGMVELWKVTLIFTTFIHTDVHDVQIHDVQMQDGESSNVHPFILPANNF